MTIERNRSKWESKRYKEEDELAEKEEKDKKKEDEVEN